MNGIYGLFNLDGEPVDSDQLAVMEEALAFWAVDGASQWKDREIGLGCLHLASTPEAVGERLPLHDAASGLTLAAGARLDNRPELLNQLKIEPHHTQATVTDGEIILRAYQRWGQDCVHHLDGDWHFAIWDEEARSLFLARDHHGNTALYHYHDPHCFAFASSKKALLALDMVPKTPDLLHISQLLSLWPGDGMQTSYEHILRLPPAHRMRIASGKAKTERYWFPENVSELHLKSDDEYVDAFLDVFTRAVSDRLRTQHPVSVTLSGGLDSGSVMAVAADLMREGDQSLIAFTSAPLSDTSQYTDPYRFGDESQLAQATARHAGNVEHHLVRAESYTPMAGIERFLCVHDGPNHGVQNYFWIAALMEAARQRGVGVLLTGQLGNATISWTGAGENLLPSLLEGDMAGFWCAFQNACQGAGLGHWRGVRRYLLKPLVDPLKYQFQKRWPPLRNSWQEFSAIRPDFARKIKLGQQMAEAGFIFGASPPDPLQQRLRVIKPGRSIVGASCFDSGAAYGLEVRDPTQDRRVIELCLSIPDDQFQRGGVNRWLIRRAMRGYLPDVVRLNPKRGLQAADVGKRVLENRNDFEAAIAEMEKHDLTSQILDLPRMKNVLASMQHGLTPKNTLECGNVLMNGVMAGLFLLQFK